MNGTTFNAELDGERLATQLNRVQALMSDSKFRTLREIAEAVNGSEAGVSARLRDLRKQALLVNRKRIATFRTGDLINHEFVPKSHCGIWAYQVLAVQPMYKWEGSQAVFL